MSRGSSIRNSLRKPINILHLGIICISLVVPCLSHAQISIPAVDVVLSQDFNTLITTGTGSTLPAGWAFIEGGGNNMYTAGNGSSSTEDTYSFGTGTSTERALGQINGQLTTTIGASFTNNTGTTINTLLISYAGEQWRLGATGRLDKLDFQYSLNATSLSNGTWTNFDLLDFIAPITSGTVGALDGNLATNRTYLSKEIPGLAIGNGATFWIRWNFYNANQADDGLGIDDFSISANPTANYTIFTTSNNIILTDIDGNSDVIDVYQDGAYIKINVPGRTYSLNAGPILSFPYFATIGGLNGINISAGGGDDIINFAPFTLALPKIITNGGIGNDVVNFNGDITMLATAFLDADMQNDDPNPGIDHFNFAPNANLTLGTSGAATIKVSGGVMFNTGSGLSTINGNLTIEANQQSIPTPGNFVGINLAPDSYVTVTGTGVLTMKGRGGNSGSNQHGIFVNGGDVTGGTTGLTTLAGMGGLGSASNNIGLLITGSASTVTTNGSNLLLSGMHGGGAGSLGFVHNSGALIQTTAPTGSISISANSAQIQSSINAGAGSIYIYSNSNMTPIELGTTTDFPPGPLSISDAELDLLLAGQISIGSPGCGNLNLTSNITRSALTHMILNSSDNVVLSNGSINTSGGNLTIDPGSSPSAFEPILPGTDVMCNMMSFAGSLEFDINGTVPDVSYTQLKIMGSINLTGASLQITGTHTPNSGEVFILIDNDGTDAITGTFTDLPQGATIHDFLVTGIDAIISYTGGNGNDVQVQVVGGCPLMVTNTADSGTGSLRQAASCAVNGDTIKFHSSMAGQTINITSSVIQFDKDIVIMGNVNPRVIISSNIQGLFQVLSQGDVEFINVNMISGNGVTGSGAAFLNSGILRLNGVQIVRKPTLPIGAHLVKNQSGSQLWLKGMNGLNYD